jgi:F0F1-type ATP synthase gamma subunit
MIFNKIFFLRKKFHYWPTDLKSQCLVTDDKGQTFIEFLLLLLVLITLSMGMVGGFNNTIAKQWRALVKAISIPNNTNDFDL